MKLTKNMYMRNLACLLLFLIRVVSGSSNSSEFEVGVGVVLDVDSLEGKMGLSYLSMAHDDFYAAHKSYKTRLVLHVRDSKGQVINAAASAIDLLKEEKVNAIIGPQKSSQASFLIEMGDKAQVPIISFSATIPSQPFSPPNSTSYFIQTSQSDATQIGAIVAIVKAFQWLQVVLIFEDTDYGHGMPPYLANALHDIDARVSYRSIIPLSTTDDFILEELYKMMTMQTRVFIVQMSPSLATRLFMRAKEIGMMREGYVWIITSGLMDLLCSLSMDSPVVLEAMQGVLGVRPLIPQFDKLESFTSRWRRQFLLNNTGIKQAEPSIFGLWAYDSVWALAMAAERVAIRQQQFTGFGDFSESNSTNPFGLGISQTGPKLLQEILDTRFRGLAGDFHLSNGQLQPSAYQILNIVGKREREVGIWTPSLGISRNLNMQSVNSSYSISKENLRAIIWPGESFVVPKGWEIPVTGKKLKIGVPVKEGFTEFVNVERDPHTNSVKVTGFCIDVFDAVMNLLPYPVPYEYVPYAKADGTSAGSYTDLVHQVLLQNFDAAVGDITITANRSMYVDFTIPYAEGGVSMIVPIRYEDWDDKWTFLKPLKPELWLTSIAFFIVTGAAVWILEHRINIAFRGPPSQHIGMLLYFPFSTLVFAHREQIVSNLARLVVVVWVFVVLILNSTYTASLSSRLTVQRLKPAINDIQQLLKNKDNVGYETGSFIADLLRGFGFQEANLKPYVSDEECHDALTKGTQNGGISAFFEAGTHTKLFLSKYCDKYMIVGPVYRTDGFAFVLPKGSPLVSDISRAVISMTEGNKILQLEKMWLSYEPKCMNPESTTSSDGVTLGSFLGLFAITGAVTGICLIIYFAHFIFKNKEDLQQIRSTSINTWSGVCGICKYFDQRDQQWQSFYRDGHGLGGCQNNHQQCCQNLHGIGLVSLQNAQSSISPRVSNGTSADSCSGDREDEGTSDEIRPNVHDPAPIDHV